jgi:hypothetical protein
MNKLLFAGIIALVVLLVFPMAVSAANTVSINGFVPVTQSIDVGPSSFNFGSMGAVNIAGPSYVDVTTSSTSWHVDATSSGNTTAGYMANTTQAKWLGAAFNMSYVNGPTWHQTTSVSGPWTTFMSGSAGHYNQTVYVQQLVAPTDSSGTYSIVATFTLTTS